MIKRALYAGSFDPITNGHLDIITRAARQFDRLVIGVIANPSKKPCFTTSERKELIRLVTASFENVEVSDFTGLLADYVNENDFNVVIRGLRATTDFENEIQMAQMNARLYKGNVETIFLMTCPGYSFISSNIIKEVFALGGEISGLVPDEVLARMKKNNMQEGPSI